MTNASHCFGLEKVCWCYCPILLESQHEHRYWLKSTPQLLLLHKGFDTPLTLPLHAGGTHYPSQGHLLLFSRCPLRVSSREASAWCHVLGNSHTRMMCHCNQTPTLEMPHLINSEDELLRVYTLPHKHTHCREQEQPLLTWPLPSPQSLQDDTVLNTT